MNYCSYELMEHSKKKKSVLLSSWGYTQQVRGGRCHFFCLKQRVGGKPAPKTDVTQDVEEVSRNT